MSVCVCVYARSGGSCSIVGNWERRERERKSHFPNEQVAGERCVCVYLFFFPFWPPVAQTVQPVFLLLLLHLLPSFPLVSSISTGTCCCVEEEMRSGEGTDRHKSVLKARLKLGSSLGLFLSLKEKNSSSSFAYLTGRS